MLKYAVWQWDNNKGELEEAIRADRTLNSCDYKHLVQLVIRHILNGKNRMTDFEHEDWSEEVHEIDDGHYRGTLIFAISLMTYQPGAHEYLFTTVDYGSCSVCDLLQSMQGPDYDIHPREEQVMDFMALCKDLVTRLVQPFPGYGFELEQCEMPKEDE